MNRAVHNEEAQAKSPKMITNFSRSFINIGSMGAAVSYLSLWIGTFYLKIPMDSVIGWSWNDGSSDGECPSVLLGVGRHCFSDYYSPVQALHTANPWEDGYAYTPLAAQLFYPFDLIGQLFKYPRAGLITYLAIGVICVLIPTIWASRHSRPTSYPILLIFGVLATPLVNAFDRGSFVMFITPLLFAYALNICRQNWQIAVFAASVLSGIKPQFIVLLLPFLVYRQWANLRKGLRWGIGLNLLGFATFTSDPFKIFKQWIEFSLKYNDQQAQFGSSQANISPINTLSYFLNLPISLINKTLHTNMSINHLWTVAIVTIAIVLPLLITGKKTDLFGITVISLVISSIFIPTSNYYYQVFAVVIAALIIRNPLKKNDRLGGILDQVNFVSRFGLLTKWIILVATFNSCFNLAISDNVLPFRENSPLAPGNVSRVFAGPLWVAAIFCIVIDAVLTFRKTGVS